MEIPQNSSKGRLGQSSLRIALILACLAILVSSLYLSSGISAQGCTQETHELFTNAEDESEVEFPDGGGVDTSLKMSLPIGADVLSASAHLEGSPKTFSSDRPLDIVLVNDVSNSMDDNCPGGSADPGETPCKINDMKDASKTFAADVLGVEDNTLGLVSYSSKVKSTLPLTENLTAIEEEVDTYTASGYTCVSCGLQEAIGIATTGSNDEQVIVLMTDGNANFCIPGFDCNDPDAEEQALYMAESAWDNHSISIITVGFGEDADEALLQAIADVSGDNGGIGQYFYANETDIETLYEQIAGILTSVYPENPYLDVGSDGSPEWSHSGTFSGADDASDYSVALEGLLADCTCTGCQISGSDCIVDFELGSDTAGFISLDTTVETEICIECVTDSDCDYLDDECNDGVCNVDNQCVQQPKADMTPCDDGNACTVDDVCMSGSCISGDPLDCDDGNMCTEDLCDTQTGCYYEDDNEGVQCGLDAFTCVDSCTRGRMEYTCQSGACLSDSFIDLFDCSPYGCESGSCGDCSFDCGAECEDDADCPDTECDQLDGCVGNDYHDYHDQANDCLGDCTCEDNSCGSPTIYPNDPRCVECVVDDDCDYLDDECNDGVCDNSNVCIAQPKPLSTPCEADGDFCTVDHCDGSGSCVYEEDYDCDDGVSCTVDSCNEATDSCDNTPDDGLCDNGLYCDGDETCHPENDCQPGSAVDCSAYDFPEISQCDYDPDQNPFTWDHAAGFTSTCNEQADACITGIYSFTHQCRDDDLNDGVDSMACGAECDQHADCVCPQDGCVGDDYYDYPDQGTCQSDCTCTGCDPIISLQDPRCISVCDHDDGMFGEGHQWICHGDGTYDECREDETGYDYTGLCMEECSASPMCEGYPPMYYFQVCDWHGQDYLQDYCDDQCQIRDDHCESTWDGCTAEPECDETIPGTDSCNYQCEYKPEICYIDGVWGDEPHQYVCMPDNTYKMCVDLGTGYGTEYVHVNECSYLCSGDLECEGLAPGTELESCSVTGEDYLQDYCDMSCMLQDDNCEADYPDCTSDPGCDEAVPGTTEWEQCFTCRFQFCGDMFINPNPPFNEQCDPDADDSEQCPQEPEQCEPMGSRLGLRDAYGDCDGCLCDQDPYVYECVEGECGAECDEDADCGNFCTGDTLSYGGQCDLLQFCDCSWNTVDCNDFDDDYFVDFHCDVASGDIWNWYQDWVCAENGQADCAYSGSDWMFDIHEDCVDDCSDTDGGIEFNVQGTATDRELCDDEGQTECPESSYSDFCSVDGEVLTEYYCEADDVAWTTFDCDSLDYYDDYVYYCEGDDVRRHRQLHDFSCSPSGCTEDVSWVDDELVESCTYDGWYNYGNEPGLDDPECENRDYTCVENGQAECGYSVTESHDYDTQDGSYCIDSDEGVEDRDYYCDSSGQAQYAASNQQDCGTEAWSGGGITPGFGDDPACVYTDYFCVDSGTADYCDSDQPYSEDFDFMDVTECDGPFLLGDHDYFCDLGSCDSQDPSQGCSEGDAWYNLRCDEACGAECDEDSDCSDSTCSVAYSDSCNGMKLREYDSDRVMDTTRVTDSCPNTCILAVNECGCTDCQPDCSPPAVSEYCVEGVCGAECDSDDDCPPWLDWDTETCHYDRDCGSDCGCPEGSAEFCPPAGTTEQGVCYYGTRDCVDLDGCTLDTCVLEPGQFCDPDAGCEDVPCIDIDPITLFSDSTAEKVIEFPDGGGSDSSAKVDVAKDLVVYTATVNLSGSPVSFTEDRILDFALVNDVSGSMDNNCNCSDGSASTNGYCSPSQGYPYDPTQPCKIDDMKEASDVFAETVLDVDGNMLGLVSYSSKLKSYLDLTDVLADVQAEIDTYEAQGHTCISCGIRKGIEIVNAGTNDPVIILMTDGLANRCFAGTTCGETQAKAQALSEAQRAWDDYGISIIAVAFGEDADQELMYDIGQVSASEGGLGNNYSASETDLVDIYNAIATELTKTFPGNPSLDVGSDGDTQWSYAGEFMSSETADFAAELQSLLDCSCPGCQHLNGECRIDLELISETAGIMTANNLEITGCIPDPPLEVSCYSCSNCGGGLDCTDYGQYSQWVCDYTTICDQEATCTRERPVTTYICQNEGTESSFCDYSVTMEPDSAPQTRQTEGVSCDDGLWCTVEDSCSSGSCSGSPRDCGEQVCDEDLDACVDEGGSDSDGDGVEDSEDACPGTFGEYCNGCPEPGCTGCAIPDCPSSGPPTCIGDDSQCAAVDCPEDGCGLDTCSSEEMADYPESVDSSCVLDGSEGTCDSPTCDGTATCTLDELCGYEPPCEHADHILISEVLYDPTGTEPDSEWVELYNPTVSLVDLSGWYLEDNMGTWSIPASTTIGAGEYLSIANDGEAYNTDNGCYPDLDGLGLGLNNGEEALSLYDSEDALIDSVIWEQSGGWEISGTDGLSIVRDPSYCDTDAVEDWLSEQTPTPVCGDPPEEPPAAVEGFTIGEGSIKLSWTASPSPDVVAYNLYFSDEWGNYDFSTPDVVVDAEDTEYVVGEAFASMPAFGVVIRAENSAGLLSEPSKELGKETIELLEGSNMVTISLITGQFQQASDILDTVEGCDAVNWYDPVAGEWLGWISWQGGYGDDFPVETGGEYEVSVGADTSLTLLGEVPQA